MLSQKPAETTSAPEQPHTMTDVAADADTVQAIMEVIQGVYIRQSFRATFPYPRRSASPEFRMASDFSEFLTSPMEDSPFEDFLTTPALGTSDMSVDMLTSPAIFDADAFPDAGDGVLFGIDGFGLGPVEPSRKPLSAAPPASSLPPASSINFDDMYRMP